MAYTVRCPECGEVNGGSHLRCVKCQASLVGIPREQDGSPAPAAVEAAPERPARKTINLVAVSLCLGILAVITSFPFWLLLMILFPGWNCEGFSILCWWYYGWGVIWTSLVSLASGVAGVVAGSLSLKRRIGEKGKAIAGIVWGGLALVFIIYFMAFITTSGWGA